MMVQQYLAAKGQSWAWKKIAVNLIGENLLFYLLMTIHYVWMSE
jgi:hypothetical protein